MKTTALNLLSAIALTSLLVGCVSPNGRPDYTGSGALIGGASGATIGALADRHNPGAGALIGGAAGLIAGGLLGHSMDQQAEAQRQANAASAAYAASPTAPPPSLADIKAMAKAGVSDDLIISQINSTRAVYHLDANDIIDLTNSGVSQKVITCMLNTANLVVSQAPPQAPTQTVVVSPGPDYVWMDGEWVWNGGAWIWIGGRWVLPPYPHAVWIRARWVHGPHGWHRVRGRWR
jgi:Glycine zipper/WXXGXW repeat (2 copies)